LLSSCIVSRTHIGLSIAVGQSRGPDSQGGSSQSSISSLTIKRRNFYFDDDVLPTDKREEAIKSLMLLGGVWIQLVLSAFQIRKSSCRTFFDVSSAF
jgi:hypothetical protein